MSSNILIAFQIAFVGMAIVFTAITLVWILISVITFTGSKQKTSQIFSKETSRKQKAVALAVARALMEQKISQSTNYHLPPTAIVSAWQLSMRTNQMKKGGKKND